MTTVRNNFRIKVTQKINLKLLTQSYISVFLNRPDQGIHHELTLLKKYRTRLFRDVDSFYPYYTAAFICKNLDNLFRNENIPVKYKSYELHIAFIMKELIMKSKKVPKYFNGKPIEKYCEELLSAIEEPDRFLQYAVQACDKFDEITEEWVKIRGENFRYGRKDSEEFTLYIKDYIKASNATVALIGKIINSNFPLEKSF